MWHVQWNIDVTRIQFELGEDVDIYLSSLGYIDNLLRWISVSRARLDGNAN